MSLILLHNPYAKRDVTLQEDVIYLGPPGVKQTLYLFLIYHMVTKPSQTKSVEKKK